MSLLVLFVVSDAVSGPAPMAGQTFRAALSISEKIDHNKPDSLRVSPGIPDVVNHNLEPLQYRQGSVHEAIG